MSEELDRLPAFLRRTAGDLRGLTSRGIALLPGEPQTKAGAGDVLRSWPGLGGP